MAINWRIVSSFSSVPHMLDEADFLLGLCNAQATGRSSHERTLAANAAVLLAVCLDQGTLSVLDNAFRTTQAVESPRRVAEIQALNLESLRRRVVRLPSLLTNSVFQLDGRSDEVSAIHDLINLRNDLMHVTEEAAVSSVRELANIEVSTPQVANRWLLVTPEEVRKYRTAVGIYVDEVLFPASGIIGKGKIVIMTSGSGDR